MEAGYSYSGPGSKDDKLGVQCIQMAESICH